MDKAEIVAVRGPSYATIFNPDQLNDFDGVLEFTMSSQKEALVSKIPSGEIGFFEEKITRYSLDGGLSHHTKVEVTWWRPQFPDISWGIQFDQTRITRIEG